MRDRPRLRTHSRGRGASSPTSSVKTGSPKQSFGPEGERQWFHQSYDDYDNETRCTEDTFDCRDSQLSLSIPRVNTGYTDTTGLTGYSAQTGLTGLTGYTAQTGLTGDYTADTFRSEATNVRRMPATRNAGHNKASTSPIEGLLETAPSLASPRRGFHNQSVILTPLPDDADNGAALSSNALEIQPNFIEHKSRDELKPFAIVEVEASTVSAMDTTIRRNRFLRSPTKPYRMGCDMIGKVVRAGLGSQTYGISEGDRVCAMNFDLGGQSKYVMIPCYDLIPAPPSLGDSTHAVCALRAYVMAYQCLYHVGDRPLMEGDRVLVVGGTGAIGQAVVELALEGGARFVYVTGTGDKVSRLLQSRGATLLDRDPAKWLPDVEGNMDIVVDLVGLDGYDASTKALKSDGSGKVVCAGTPTDPNQTTSSIGNIVVTASMSMSKVAANLMQNVSTYDFFASIERDPEGYKEDLIEVFHLLKQNKISPRISKFVLLDEVVSAHKAIEAGGLDGHVICRPNPTSKFVYNEKKENNDLSNGGRIDARDDAVGFVLDMLDERSYGSIEDQSEYSQSVISRNASGESDFTDFTTGTNFTTGTFNSQFSSQTGTSSFNTFGLFSRKKKKQAYDRTKILEKTKGDETGRGLLGGIATLAAIGENIAAASSPNANAIIDGNEEIETQDGSIQTNQGGGGADLAPVTTSEADKGLNLAAESEPNKISGQEDISNYSSDQSPTSSKRWLKRMPSFSKKKGSAESQSSPAPSGKDQQSSDASPIVSEKVIKTPSPKNVKASATSIDPVQTSQQNEENCDTMEFLPCMGCFCTTSETEQKIDDRNGTPFEDVVVLKPTLDSELQQVASPNNAAVVSEEEIDCDIESNILISDVQSAVNNAISVFAQPAVKNGDDQDGKSNSIDPATDQVKESQDPTNGGIRGALADLFGFGLISQPSPAPKENDKPIQITILEDQEDEPSALPVDLSVVATQSDGSSTFVAKGVVLNDPFLEPLAQEEKQPASDEMSALTGATKALLATPQKRGMPLNLPSFRRQRSLSRSQGLAKSTCKSSAITLTRSRSTRSSRQGTAGTSVSLTRTTNSSAVSIKCGQSQREFHVPSTVASSAMSVASSRSKSSARNIYAKRSGGPQRGGTVQRLPPGGNNGRSNLKSIFSKKK